MLEHAPLRRAPALDCMLMRHLGDISAASRWQVYAASQKGTGSDNPTDPYSLDSLQASAAHAHELSACEWLARSRPCCHAAMLPCCHADARASSQVNRSVMLKLEGISEFRARFLITTCCNTGREPIALLIS